MRDCETCGRNMELVSQTPHMCLLFKVDLWMAKFLRLDGHRSFGRGTRASRPEFKLGVSGPANDRVSVPEFCRYNRITTVLIEPQ